MLATDIRDALRGFAKNRGFVAAAVLSLALGVGANSAIFSVASALLLRPLPYEDPDRLVILWNQSPGLAITQDWFSTAQYFDIKNVSKGLEQVAILYGANENLTGDGVAPERVGTIRVSSNLFPMLGVGPPRGRLFTAEEDAQLPAATALVGYRTWVRRYGLRSVRARAPHRARTAARTRSSACCPSPSRCRRRSCRRVGTASDAEMVLPLPQGPNAAQARNREDFNVVARLKRGATVAQVQQEMDALTVRLRRDFPDFYPPNGGLTFSVVPLQRTGRWRRTAVPRDPDRRGDVRAADCLRQRRQPAAVARRRAASKEIAVRSALGAEPARASCGNS